MYQVFITDDEPWIVEYFSRMIDWKGHGWELAGTACDGETAYKMLTKKPVDLLITDIRMPGIDGLELIWEVRDKIPYFIIVSGYADFSYAQKGISMGVTEYLLKPVEKGQVYGALEKIAAKIADKSGGILREDIQKDAVSQAVEYASVHYRNEITLQDLARRFYISAPYLSAAFKKKTGKTFSQYITELRLDRAREYLERQEYTVEAVRNNCGFNDYSNFCKAFRSRYGVSPGRYKKCFREGADLKGNRAEEKNGRL